MKSSPLTAPFGANLPAMRAFLLDTVYPLGAVCRSCGRLSDGSPLCPDCSRRLRADGVSVICIFTGEDVDLPYARMVYGQDFVRIRDFSHFADTVGKLIIDQMKRYSM